MDHHESLPLSEAVFFILLSLLQGPKHGYRIMKDVLNMSESRVNLSTGTLYGALKRMLESGWVRRIEVDGKNEGGRQKKSYVLTQMGRSVLEAETVRLENLVSAAQKHSAAGGEI